VSDSSPERSAGVAGGPHPIPHELVVSGLEVSLSGRPVLKGIDLTVRSGEIHALMGPNGSGKSTLAHVLMGRPGSEVTAGAVTLDGQDLLALPAWRRARLGLFLAPQYPTEIPGVQLVDALSAAGGDGGHGEDRAMAALAGAEADRVGFPVRLLERSLNVDLSGGERKRSETLQLGVLRPTVAVLDELDSGLDVDGLRQVARRVGEARAEWGLGVLAITHYRRLLSELRPDAVHVLVDGRTVAEGGPELADELERTGYAAYREAAAGSRRQGAPGA
jgi:Fe-S cluster assembly ATP-binding protein